MTANKMNTTTTIQTMMILEADSKNPGERRTPSCDGEDDSAVAPVVTVVVEAA